MIDPTLSVPDLIMRVLIGFGVGALFATSMPLPPVVAGFIIGACIWWMLSDYEE